MKLVLTPNERGLVKLALDTALAKEPTDLTRPDQEIALEFCVELTVKAAERADRPKELWVDEEAVPVLFGALEDATRNLSWHPSARGVLLPIMRKLEASE